jgi:Conserved TM helix
MVCGSILQSALTFTINIRKDMNETWQFIISAGLGTNIRFFAQPVPPPPLTPTGVPVPPVASPIPAVTVDAPGLKDMVTKTSESIGSFLPHLLGGVLILLIGWIVAFVVSSLVRKLLERTDLDNRLGNFITGGSRQLNTEKLFGDIVFWIIFLFALVGFLNTLQLPVVAQPLNDVLGQILAFVPKIGGAAVLGAIAWILATAVRTVVIRTTGSLVPAMSRRLAVGDNQVLPSETLGNALYWLVFLFFLPAILSSLGMTGPLAPVQNLLNEILSALPNIFKAGLIGLVGWFLARVVRELVTNLLAAAGTERFAAQIGLHRAAPGQSLSSMIGTLIYVMILIPTAVAALEALQIPSISKPATSMLQEVLNAIPQILTAGGILVVAYVISGFIGELVTNLLTGFGFNNIFQIIGLNSVHQTIDRIEPGSQKRTPSEVAGIVARVGVMLTAAVAATGVLNIPALTLLVNNLLAVSGQVLSGIVVFAIGLYLANLAQRVVSSSGTHQAHVLGQVARLAIITFVGAMALQQMGIAPSIVNLAFGLVMGAVAIALAISFGLGGRDVASEQLREWMSTFRDKR